MHTQLVPLLLLISHLAITDTVGNINGIKRPRTKEETKLTYGPEIRYGNESQVRPIDVRAVQYRFVDWDNSLKRQRKGAAPIAGQRTGTDSSFFDYFDEGGEGEHEEQEDDDDDDEEEDEEEEEEEEEKEEDGEEDDENGVKEKYPPFLRGGRRKYVKVHKIIFPLLLAYKLKFFTMLPLLVGSLVLLVGTTSIAGFFFALFSAALGLQVKARH